MNLLAVAHNYRMQGKSIVVMKVSYCFQLSAETKAKVNYKVLLRFSIAHSLLLMIVLAKIMCDLAQGWNKRLIS